jgi:hypothetical protein
VPQSYDDGTPDTVDRILWGDEEPSRGVTNNGYGVAKAGSGVAKAGSDPPNPIQPISTPSRARAGIGVTDNGYGVTSGGSAAGKCGKRGQKEVKGRAIEAVLAGKHMVAGIQDVRETPDTASAENALRWEVRDIALDEDALWALEERAEGVLREALVASAASPSACVCVCVCACVLCVCVCACVCMHVNFCN